MKLVVGLGNPGAEYDRTRHNAGFMAIDRLVERHAAGQPARAKFHAAVTEAALPGAGKALLIKPTTFMNRSGLAVAEAVNFYKLDPAEDLLVIVDDVALPVGAIRLRAAGGDGGHNGLGDICRALATVDYARLRVGIDPPGPVPQRDYVLRRFTPEQAEAMGPALDRAADAAELWAREGAEAAMNRFNVKGSGFAPAASAEPADDTDTDQNAANGAA